MSKTNEHWLEKYDPRQLAEELFEERDKNNKENNRDLSFHNDHIAQTWKFYGARLKAVEKKCAKGVSNAVVAHKLIVSTLELLFETTRYKEDVDNFESAIRFWKLSNNVFSKTYGKDIEDHMRTQKIGAFAFGIQLFGSKNCHNAANRIVAKLTGEKERTIQKYNYAFQEHNPHWLEMKEKERAISFVNTHINELTDILQEYDVFSLKSGSNKHDKIAFKAFLDLLNIMSTVPTRLGGIYKLNVSETFNYCPNFNKEIDRNKAREDSLLTLAKQLEEHGYLNDG